MFVVNGVWNWGFYEKVFMVKVGWKTKKLSSMGFVNGFKCWGKDWTLAYETIVSVTESRGFMFFLVVKGFHYGVLSSSSIDQNCNIIW